jgi:hypothetical protein
MKSLVPALSALVMCAIAGCASHPTECAPGSERCACLPNLTCNDGLSCISSVCVNSGSSGGAGTAGQSGTGGTTRPAGGTAGAAGAGGSSSAPSTVVAPPPASPNCTDVSVTTSSLTSPGGSASLEVDGNPNKTYFILANWNSEFRNEVETVTGLSFSMTNPTGAVTTKPNYPMGYPCLFIGSYSGHTTKGSNLPKQVSALTGVPTVFQTNVGNMGNSNYNATYDVWFTPTATPLPSNQYTPGTGGAYLMVWLFMPTDRQPRGRSVANGRTITGVPGTWDVWMDSTNPPCVSYVSTNKVSQLDFDLKNFIQDAVTNGRGVTSSMYLSVVFAGFEVWGGGDGLQVKAFCANVN